MHYFVYQGNDQDCGFASLKMLLCYIQHNPAFLHLAKEEGKKRLYSYQDLLTIAANNGVTLRAYRLIDKEEIKTYKSWPMLASLEDENQHLHMVMIKMIRHGKVYFNDPRRGKMHMKCSNFIKMWDGTFLRVIKVKKTKPTKTDRHIITILNHISLIIMQTLSALFALIGFAFISAESYFTFPLLFFALSIVGELMFRRYQFIILERFDQRFLVATYDIDKRLMRDKFTRYHDFKRRYFLFPQMIVQSSVIVLTASLVLVFNDLLHFFFLILLFVFILFDSLWRVWYDTKKRQGLEKMENDVFSCELSKEAVAKHLKAMSQASLSLAKSITTRKYVGVFLVAIAALVYTAIYGEVSLNFFIFHFLFYMLFYDNLVQLTTCLLDADQMKRRSTEFKDEFV